MRSLFAEYKIKRNGGCDYECFHLSKMMDTYAARIKKKDENLIHVLVSPGEPNDTGCLSWHKYKPKHETKIKYNQPRLLLVPEFLNRYAFVSSYASLINEVSVNKGLEYHHALQLLYVALLTPSPIQFQWVVRHVTNNFNRQNNLCHEYIKHCKNNGLMANGGPESRFMVGKESELPNGLEEIEKNLDTLRHAIESLNRGDMLNDKGKFVNNRDVVNLKGVGPARAISFPSLCCFTGLGISEHAILTAKQAIINSETRHRYAGDRPDEPSKLGLKLKVDGDSLPYNDKYYNSILDAVGQSIGELQSTMESASCAITRTIGRHDVFFEGQTLYCLFLDAELFQKKAGKEEDESKIRSTVYEKRFGSEQWSKAILPQWNS